MKEVERRFLVENIDGIDLSQFEKKEIEQYYLYRDKIVSVRKRKLVMPNGDTHYIHTVKYKLGENKFPEEYEVELTKEQYEALEVTDLTKHIEKDRYIIPVNHFEGYEKYSTPVIELDIFKGYLEGLIFAEIEFSDENIARNFVPMPWFDVELTHKLTNGKMSRMTRKEVDEYINEIKKQS